MMNFGNFRKREIPWNNNEMWGNNAKMEEIIKYHKEYSEHMKNKEKNDFTNYLAMEELWKDDKK